MSDEEQAKLAFYERLGLQIIENMEDIEYKNMVFLNFYINQMNRMKGEIFDASKPIFKEQQTKQPIILKNNEKQQDDWK